MCRLILENSIKKDFNVCIIQNLYLKVSLLILKHKYELQNRYVPKSICGSPIDCIHQITLTKSQLFVILHFTSQAFLLTRPDATYQKSQ